MPNTRLVELIEQWPYGLVQHLVNLCPACHGPDNHVGTAEMYEFIWYFTLVCKQDRE